MILPFLSNIGLLIYENKAKTTKRTKLSHKPQGDLSLSCLAAVFLFAFAEIDFVFFSACRSIPLKLDGDVIA